MLCLLQQQLAVLLINGLNLKQNNILLWRLEGGGKVISDSDRKVCAQRVASCTFAYIYFYVNVLTAPWLFLGLQKGFLV